MYYSSTICFLYINYTINRQSIFTGGKHKINRQRLVIFITPIYFNTN